jgi:DNA-binding LytR/AlgR family response regulator
MKRKSAFFCLIGQSKWCKVCENGVNGKHRTPNTEHRTPNTEHRTPNMIRSLIIEDNSLEEKKIRRVLSECNTFLPEHEQIEIVGTLLEQERVAGDSAVELATQLIERIKPNIVFLDMELDNQLDGLEILDHFSGKQTFQAIITTSHLHLAIAAWIKTSRIEQMMYILEKARRIRDNQKATIIQTFDSISVGAQEISPNKIVYCEASNQYVKMYILDNYMKNTEYGLRAIRITLKELALLLPPKKFLSVHRSYLINLDFVEKFSDKNISLRGRISIPIAREKKKSVVTTLKANGKMSSNNHFFSKFF